MTFVLSPAMFPRCKMPDYIPPLAVAQQRPRHLNPHGKIRLNFQGK